MARSELLINWNMTKKLFNEQNEIVNLSRKLFRIKVNARF